MTGSPFQGPSVQQDPPHSSRVHEWTRGSPHAVAQQQQRPEVEERRLLRSRQLEILVGTKFRL